MDNVAQLKGNTKNRGSKKEAANYRLNSLAAHRHENEDHIAYAERLLSDPGLAKDLQLNTMEQCVEVKEKHTALHPALTPGRLEDKHITALWVLLRRKGARVSHSETHKLIYSVAGMRAYDPLMEQIRAVEGKWDKEPRIDTWLSRYMKAKDTEYTRAVGRKFLIQMVVRALAPINASSPLLRKCDAMLVLESTEGYHKSSALSVLAGHDYFSDTMTSISAKDAPQYLIKNWVVELPELKAFEGKSPEEIKSFLSAVEQDYRFPWDRETKRYLRRCVFVGTTNHKRYLTSSTGNRRFWPVFMEAEADIKGLERDRAQLLAEACAAYREGHQWWLTRKEMGLADEECKGRLLREPWAEALEEELAERKEKFIPSDEIKELVEECGGRFNGSRVRQVCEALGWRHTRQRTSVGRVWGYAKS